MSYESDIKRLTVDPGTITLAKAFDLLMARVDACCGTSGTNVTARATAAEASPVLPEKHGQEAEAAPLESDKKSGVAPSGRGRKS